MIKTKTTEQGKAAIASAIAGKKLTFTRFAIGDGYDLDDAPEKKTALSNELFSVGISSLKDNGDGTVTVEGVFSSNDTARAFYYREIGLYATVSNDDSADSSGDDSDSGDTDTATPVLILYGNAGQAAEYIPAWADESTDSDDSDSGEEEKDTYVEKRISFKIVVVNTAKITARIESASFATKAYVDTAVADLQAQINELKK